MNQCKKIINVLLALMMVALVTITTQAFDFSTDANFHKFTEGYRSYVTPIKDKDIVWSNSEKFKISTMDVVINGTALTELRHLMRIGDIKLESFKHSDGTSYVICTGRQDVTGHTIVVMMEPKNNLAYVYDTDSYASEVVDLGAYVQLYKGRTLVPLRKTIEIFGGIVKYYSKGNYDIIWPSLHK